jgi:dihydrofolate synthase/folylpolyglutamate synthase
VFSALKDKQGQKMRQQLEEAFDEVITTGFSHDRADSTDHHGGGCVIADWKDAIEAAVQKAGEHGTVIITGSLYFISAVRAFLKHPER